MSRPTTHDVVPSANLRKADVAAALGVTVVTVDRLMRDGLLSYTKVGRAVRFTHEQVEDFLTRARRQRAS